MRICGEASPGRTAMEPRRRLQMSPSFIPAAERQEGEDEWRRRIIALFSWRLQIALRDGLVTRHLGDDRGPGRRTSEHSTFGLQ